MKSRLFRRTVVALAFPFAASAGFFAQHSHAESLTDGNIAALMSAADTNDIQEAKLAQDKAESMIVKQLAAHLVEEHTAMLTRGNLLTVEAKLIPMLPAAGQELVKAHEDVMATLREKSGAAFDQAFLESQIASHKRVLDLLDRAGHDARTYRLKELIAEARTRLLKHLYSAEAAHKIIVAEAR